MKNFNFLVSDTRNVYYNLATEEYLLKNKSDYYIFLWINSPTCVVGINQNTLKEINISVAREKNINIARRLTGGGAVYHDEDNICYSVIAPFEDQENSFLKFCTPIIEYLNGLGVKAGFSGRNDICIDDMKISGNAQTVYKDRILHHGTLLFDTDLNVLESVLNVNQLKIQSKGINSVKKRVTNIKNYLPEYTCAKLFKNLSDYFSAKYNRCYLSENETMAIDKLEKEKYSTYEWNIGYSPKGKTTFEYKFDFGIFTLTFDLVNGIIDNAEIFGDFFSKKDIKLFADRLNGKRFEVSDLTPVFKDINAYIERADGQEILKQIFA